MKRRMIALAVLASGLALGAAPATAEHNALVEPGAAAAPDQTANLDIDLKVGARGFRLGGRLFSGEGVWGVWINGERRPDGFSLDGRLQSDARAFNFKLNAELMDELAGRAWPWWQAP